MPRWLLQHGKRRLLIQPERGNGYSLAPRATPFYFGHCRATGHHLAVKWSFYLSVNIVKCLERMVMVGYIGKRLLFLSLIGKFKKIKAIEGRSTFFLRPYR